MPAEQTPTTPTPEAKKAEGVSETAETSQVAPKAVESSQDIGEQIKKATAEAGRGESWVKTLKRFGSWAKEKVTSNWEKEAATINKQIAEETEKKAVEEATTNEKELEASESTTSETIEKREPGAPEIAAITEATDKAKQATEAAKDELLERNREIIANLETTEETAAREAKEKEAVAKIAEQAKNRVAEWFKSDKEANKTLAKGDIGSSEYFKHQYAEAIKQIKAEQLQEWTKTAAYFIAEKNPGNSAEQNWLAAETQIKENDWKEKGQDAIFEKAQEKLLTETLDKSIEVKTETPAQKPETSVEEEIAFDEKNITKKLNAIKKAALKLEIAMEELPSNLSELEKKQAQLTAVEGYRKLITQRDDFYGSQAGVSDFIAANKKLQKLESSISDNQTALGEAGERIFGVSDWMDETPDILEKEIAKLELNEKIDAAQARDKAETATKQAEMGIEPKGEPQALFEEDEIREKKRQKAKKSRTSKPSVDADVDKIAQNF